MRGAGPHHKQALIEAASSVFGVACTLEGVDTSGQLDRDLITAMLKNAGVKGYKINQAMTRIMTLAQNHYTGNCKADFSEKLCPGVRNLLETLSGEGVPMGLVTGNLGGIAWQKLENARIDKHFKFGAYSEMATTRVRLAKMAAFKARGKSLATRTCAVALIGDHANDIQAAKANGFRSVAVATGFTSADELRKLEPDLVVETLEGASVEMIFGNTQK